jgi:hypothetical protein
MIKRILFLLLAGFAVLGSECGKNGTSPFSPCVTEDLPLSGDTDGPVVTDVGLEVQAGGIVVVATATDPQGDDNLRDVFQSVGVFPDESCEGSPIVIMDDLAYSGVEETFGTAVDASTDPDLYDAIAAASDWPVEVTFKDVDGHTTSGRVRARIIR